MPFLYSEGGFKTSLIFDQGWLESSCDLTLSGAGRLRGSLSYKRRGTRPPQFTYEVVVGPRSSRIRPCSSSSSIGGGVGAYLPF